MHVPLHNHSEYSALDGYSTCKEIASRCVEMDCPCCGITDHGTVAGHLEFAVELAKQGVKPIFGAELYHGVLANPKGQGRDQAHLVVGALNNNGLRNLWRLVDASSGNFHHVGRVTWEMLEKYSDGLFATSACIQGLVAQGVMADDLDALNRYADIFKSNFYIELHTYPGAEHEALNERLVVLAQERGIPLVYANDAHYAYADQYLYHDAYIAMQTGGKDNIDMDPADRKMWHPQSLYMMDEQEVRKALDYLPGSVVDEALVNTVALGESVDAQLPEVKRHLPIFRPKQCPWLEDDTRSAAELLLDLVEKGIIDRYGHSNDEAWDRASRELEVFLKSNLEHYFLQTWDFCQFCDDNAIKRGPGRGSAAGSIVAYALNITDVDPLRYGLIFERFFNPGREKGFPDIDTDFPVKDRKIVRDYLIKRWGPNRVKTIGTITRLKPKAACDKTYNVCNVTWSEKEKLKKILSDVPEIEILGADSIGWSRESDPGKTRYVMESVGENIAKWIQDQPDARHDVLWRWIEILDSMCSRISGYGIHPSGVVVSDVDLDSELPCDLRGAKGTKKEDRVPATQFPMTAVDSRRFIKQDLLGLRNLDTLADWEKHVSFAVKWSGLEEKEHPEEMWKLLDQGLTLGIFQIEDGYGAKLCKDLKPRSVEDLSIIVALNRPGPRRTGAPDSFIRRKNGLEEVTYDHPMLEEILEPTFGWFLYQEQVIEYFNRLGYDLSESDAVRKILGKKKPEQMDALKLGEGEWEGKGYYDYALKRMDRGTATVIWKKLEEFALYSFNKSHSLAYATLALRTLFAKWKAPAEFIMACIRTNPDEAGPYVSEGRRLGIAVLAPDVRKSDVEVAVVDGRIYFGLANVKGVGKATAKAIMGIRRSFDISTPAGLSQAIETLQAEWEERRKTNPHSVVKSPRQTVRSNQVQALLDAGAFDAYAPRNMSLSELQKTEKELLGVILSDNTEEAFRNNHDLIAECDSYDQLEDGGRLELPGIITSIKETKTRAEGKKMGIVTIEWEGEAVEFAVFPNQWKAYEFMWRERTPGIFTLKRTDRGINFEQGMKLS